MASLPPRQYENDIEKYRTGQLYNKGPINTNNPNVNLNIQPPNETQNILDEVSKMNK